MKVVVNRCYGGYSLLEKAYNEMGIKWDGHGHEFDEDRANPSLVACVEKLGEESWGIYARLEIVEIPDGINWEISDYDGMERVEESHRSW